MTAQIIPGVLRETDNPLLLKASIGKPQTRGFTLPPEGFTYGIRNIGNFRTADSFSWQSKLEPLNVKKKTQRDFITLNKAATQAGLVTSKEHSQYRATHNVNLQQTVKESRTKPSKYPPPGMTFGVVTLASNPDYDLLEHKYQDEWLDTTRNNELARIIKERKQRTSVHKGYAETCASRLRRYSPKVDPPPLWQMPRFQKKALPCLKTFRSDEARERAFLHHSSDCTSRTGVFGHGTYEGAKS